MENLLVDTGLVNDYHKDSISSRCPMKIDVSKAFDSLQWDFVLSTLYTLNFPEKFIHWIHLCITTASFSVEKSMENWLGSLEAKGVLDKIVPSPIPICYLYECVIEIDRQSRGRAENRLPFEMQKCSTKSFMLCG